MPANSLKQKVAAALPWPLREALIAFKYRGQQLPGHSLYVDAVADQRGLEIGGPSIVFKTVLPLYQRVGALDGVNYAGETLWEGQIDADRPYRYYGNKTGQQFIAEAAELASVPSGRYDFVLSSNCLEHVANPLKALAHWHRVLKANGTLVLVLPKPSSNFDHRRPVTRWEHLLQDEARDTSEHDLTHLDEILALHDLSMDPPAGDRESFRKRSLNNFRNRALHHHVFDLDLIRTMLDHADFDVLHIGETRKDFFAAARKRAAPPPQT